MRNDSDPAGELRGPTLRDVLTPIFRHKRAGILTAMALFTGTTVMVLLSPETYEAEMKILVTRERMDPSSHPNAPPPGRTDVTEDELNSEVELLKSRDLLEQVALAAGLYHAKNGSIAERAPSSAQRIAVSRT